jgi:CubicO group peptidase (beta-lactamase class C family)
MEFATSGPASGANASIAAAKAGIRKAALSGLRGRGCVPSMLLVRCLSPTEETAMLARFVLSILAAAAAPVVHAESSPLPPTAPESAGFSKERLAAIDAFFKDELERNRLPGAVLAIAREGKLVYYKAFGFRDKEKQLPATTDTIYALASMTKIMTSVGALTLTEKGKLPLQGPLSDYYPAFADMQVGKAGDDGKVELEAPKRPILIHDLFRHTSGLTYGGRPDGGSPVSAQYPSGTAAAYIGNTQQFIDTLTKLPLVHQPGTVFEYSFSIDVLGAVVEKVSGKPLGAYLNEVLWKPLKMTDTAFGVPEDKRERVAHSLPTNPITGKPQNTTYLEKQTSFDCGGACAFGTIGDYIRFGQMLLNGGSLEGAQILSPQFVAHMTSNHLGPEIKNRVANVEPHRAGYGFGLGVAVRLEQGLAAVPGNPGEFSWNGANGTGFFVDPEEELVVAFGTAAPGEIRKYYREQIQNLVYGAMNR